jgi:large subunit ribosomal protein L29
MAKDKTNYHDTADDALFAKGAELREQLFRLHFKAALGNQDTVRQMQTMRKDLARVKTEVRAREVRAEIEAGTRPTHRGTRAERKKRAQGRLRAAARA